MRRQTQAGLRGWAGAATPVFSARIVESLRTGAVVGEEEVEEVKEVEEEVEVEE